MRTARSRSSSLYFLGAGITPASLKRSRPSTKPGAVHADPAITLRVYAYVLDDQASGAATTLEQLINGTVAAAGHS
jgi:hypothetical protein